MPHRLAVLLPARNAENTLEACLAGLAGQTFPDFHVIAVDDGSTDSTLRILRQTARSWDGHPAMSVLSLSETGGIAHALAEASRHLQDEEFVGRQDADDVSLPDRFRLQLEFLDRHPEIGVLGTDVRIAHPASGPTEGALRYESWLRSCRSPEEIARNLWVECPLPHPTVVMRRRAFLGAGGYREVSWPEDYDLWLRMLRRGVRMARLPEVLYVWTDSPNRASRTQPAYRQERFLECRAHHLAAWLRERPSGPLAVTVWGAGRDGRRAARALLKEGVEIARFLDIDPRKIGRRAYGREIVSAEEWLVRPERATRGEEAPAGGGELVLAAVGTAGARDLIRGRLVGAGFREGESFLCLA